MTHAPLALQGPLVIAQAAALREQIQHALDAGTTTLDLAAVDELDSAGVQLLLAARHSAAAAGHALVLQAPSAAVQQVLQILGLQELLHATESPQP